MSNENRIVQLSVAKSGPEDVQPVAPKALLTGQAALVVGGIATLAGVVSPAIPMPWGAVVGLVAFVAALLAGVSAPVPKFAAGKPLVQGALLTGAVTTLGVVEQVLPSLPAGVPQSAAMGAATLFALLAGRASPTLVK